MSDFWVTKSVPHFGSETCSKFDQKWGTKTVIFSLSDMGLASADYILYMFTKWGTHIYPSAGRNPISLKEIKLFQHAFLI